MHGDAFGYYMYLPATFIYDNREIAKKTNGDMFIITLEFQKISAKATG